MPREAPSQKCSSRPLAIAPSGVNIFPDALKLYHYRRRSTVDSGPAREYRKPMDDSPERAIQHAIAYHQTQTGHRPRCVLLSKEAWDTILARAMPFLEVGPCAQAMPEFNGVPIAVNRLVPGVWAATQA